MRTLRKLAVFVGVAIVAFTVATTAHPKTSSAVSVLAASGLIGLIWLYTAGVARRKSQPDSDGPIYVALTLLGVAAGVGAALVF